MRLGRRGGKFLIDTLEGTISTVRRVALAEEIAKQAGLLQGLDPRGKLLALLGLLVAASLARHLESLLGLCAFALAVALLSRVPLSLFLLRIWLPTAIFAGVIALPAILNIVTPGVPLLVLLDLGQPARLDPVELPAQIAITQTGLTAASFLIARAGTSVSLIALLALTTRWIDLLRAFRAVGVPRAFIAAVEMTYRYIFLFLETLSDMIVARRSRQVGPWRPGEGSAFVGATAGILLGKSLAHGEEVYSAMVSRGYAGEPRLLEDLRFRARDVAWIGACLLAAVLTLGGDRYLGI